MKTNKIFLILISINIFIWSIFFIVYFYIYNSLSIQTFLPWKEEIELNFIKTLETYPELNNIETLKSLSWTLNKNNLLKIQDLLSWSWVTYDACNKLDGDIYIKYCKNVFVSNYLEKLINTKWLVKKEVCEEIEKRFWKTEQRNRCYMHYWTVMGDMTRNIWFCSYLPSWSWSNLNEKYIFNNEFTKENCEFIVFYSTLWNDEYQWTYLDKVKKSKNQFDSVLYQKTLNKHWNFKNITVNADPYKYNFEINENDKELFKDDYIKLKSIYDDIRSKFIIE